MEFPDLRINIAFLAVAQAVSQALGLIAAIYLTRKLGIDAFGQLAVAQAAMRYCLLFIDYGFSLSAASKISSMRKMPDDVSKLCSAILAAQALLLLIVVIFGCALGIIFSKEVPSNLLFASLFYIASSAAVPQWLLMSLERIKEVALAQVVSAIATLPLLIFLVRTPKDVDNAVLAYGIAALITSLIYIRAFKNQNLKWIRPPFKEILFAIRSGSSVFLSSLSVSFYTILPTLSLGSGSDLSQAGYYSIADKIRAASQSAMQPAFSAVFPRISGLFHVNYSNAIKLLKSSIVATSLISGLISYTVYLCSERIVALVVGHELKEAALVLKHMAPLILIISMSTVASQQILLPNQKVGQFNNGLFIGGAVALALIIALGPEQDAVTMSLVLVTVELVVCSAMWVPAALYLRRRFKKLR